LSSEQRENLLRALKVRFEKNMNRHKGLEWANVQAKLEANTEKLWSLNEMERTGGEPDVVGHYKNTGEYIFNDCSAESLEDAEVFVTTVKRWSQGKNISRKITLLIWLLTWALNF
jgi:phosphate-selective porin